MLNVLAAMCFAGFVLAALAVEASRRYAAKPAIHKLCVHLFLLYSLAVSFGAGLSQRDLWPFSAWPLVAGVLPESVDFPSLVAVDAGGVEHAIDYRAVEPLSYDELASWVKRNFPHLRADEKARAAAFLLGNIEAARVQALEGKRIGTSERYLGPVAAPYFFLHPPVWSRPDRVPANPLVRLRIYRKLWNLEERARNPGRVERILVYEYAKP